MSHKKGLDGIFFEVNAPRRLQDQIGRTGTDRKNILGQLIP